MAAKRRKATVDGELAALDELAACELDTEADRARVRQSLGHAVGIVVARAATLVGRARAEALIPDLMSAFDRLIGLGVEADPGCFAKKAVLDALDELEIGNARSARSACTEVSVRARSCSGSAPTGRGTMRSLRWRRSRPIDTTLRW